MKTVKLPDEMVVDIRNFINSNPNYGYESIAEFVRSAIRSRILEMSQWCGQGGIE